jgi:hypothetical protein
MLAKSLICGVHACEVTNVKHVRVGNLFQPTTSVVKPIEVVPVSIFVCGFAAPPVAMAVEVSVGYVRCAVLMSLRSVDACA